MSKMHIKLIGPSYGRYQVGANQNRHSFIPFNLTTVAALTPPDYEVEIDNENMEKVDFDSKVDLVGLTAATPTARRAYEFSAIYRNKGIPTVIGGLHAFLCPEEAAKYFDAVIIGEADLIWKQVLEDAAKGKLKKFYKADKPFDLKGMPFPRYDLLKNRRNYTISKIIETSRGCPFHCDFCSPAKFWGYKYRTRPVEEVVEDVKRIESYPNNYWGTEDCIFFVDDNFVGNPDRAKKLLEHLIPLNITWGSQASLTVAKDEELLNLCQKSGCRYLFIGIESVNSEVLESSHKYHNKVQDYFESIQKIHKHKIAIQGAFVFGIDGDNKDTFATTLKFINKAKLDALQFNIVYPYPGLKTTERLDQAQRITSYRWDNYCLDGVNFIPRDLTAEELRKNYHWILKKASSRSSIAKRLFWSFVGGRYSRIIADENFGLRRMARTIFEKYPYQSVTTTYWRELENLKGLVVEFYMPNST